VVNAPCDHAALDDDESAGEFATEVAGGRPSCPFCTNAIMDSGGEFTGPLGPYRFQGKPTMSQSSSSGSVVVSDER